MTLADTSPETHQATSNGAPFVLAAATMGFFMVTLDAVVVNLALPDISKAVGGGIAGLQWVVDGYTLMFAALLLASGALSDRIGAGRAFKTGLALFVVSSLACGLAPNLGSLVIARFVQGTAAAVIMPSSLALVSQAYTDKKERARAVSLWAMGGAIASTSGPIVGGLLTHLDWRLIFLINLPVGVAALLTLRRVPTSPTKAAPFDWIGQVTGIVAMGGLTYGVIEAGEQGLTSPAVITALVLAVIGLCSFVVAQATVSHPMVPLDMFRAQIFRLSLGIGFAFMVGYYGLPFVYSLYFQDIRGLTSIEAGLSFLPMMLIGLAMTPFSAGIVERVGARVPIVGGLLSMTIGLVLAALLPATTPIWVLSLLMILVGLGGPFVMPPVTAALLNHVEHHQAGTASGVLNTSRQVGGALAVAVFGALLANADHFMNGLRESLLIAAAVLIVTCLASLRLPQR